jgi:L-arabinose isomerase
VTHRIGVWARAALAAADARATRIGRLGDNMREVAVTEGDKVEWQRRIGHRVNGYGAADLVRRFHDVRSGETDALCDEYATVYKVADELLPGAERHGSLRTAAAIELALRGFLADEGLGGFTDTFEDLAGLPQLPGIAAQRLMADGYGFGAEGDWKTAALVRAVKVMGHGLPGGTSFMEDYTYHLDPAGQLVLGAHMLEVCPSLARDVPRCEVHPLSIGGAEDPVRLVFDAAAGPAVNMAVVDLGDRLRMTICPVEVVAPPEPLPRLPVARSVWKHNPDLATAAEAWILAGGSHHSVHSQAVTAAHLRSFARMLDIESVLIGPDLDIADLERELRWTDAAYRLASR